MGRSFNKKLRTVTRKVGHTASHVGGGVEEFGEGFKKGEYFTSRGLGGANIITNSLTQISENKKIDDFFTPLWGYWASDVRQFALREDLNAVRGEGEAMIQRNDLRFNADSFFNADGLFQIAGVDPKFEIRVPSHLSERDFGCGVPKSPFVRPETGLGGRGHFRGETRSRSCPSGA